MEHEDSEEDQGDINEFFRSILELSENKDWRYVKLEWGLSQYYISDEWDRCICGHRIKEVSVIKNRKTGKKATVGNCCIDKFPGQLKFMLAMRAAWECRITEDLLDFLFHECELINDYEYEFMVDTLRKRVFTEKQDAVIRRIRSKIFRVMGVECPPQ
jgi:hypothetical protein